VAETRYNCYAHTMIIKMEYLKKRDLETKEGMMILFDSCFSVLRGKNVIFPYSTVNLHIKLKS